MIKRREKIIISAIELLAEGGIQNITTKNLALKEGVTEPALYRQFGGKADILEAIVLEFANYDSEIEETIRENELRGKDAVLFYIERFAELYENFHELAHVLHSVDLYLYNEKTRMKMIEIRKRRIECLRVLIEQEPKALRITKVYTPSDSAKIIYGIISEEVLEWMLSGKKYSLKERIINLVTWQMSENENNSMEDS